MLTQRSYRTTGGVELPRVDGRLRASRRFRSLCAAFEVEIGDGELTEIERGIIRQAASLQLHIEQLQDQIVRGADVDPDQVIRLSSEHRRLLSALRAMTQKKKPPATSFAEALARQASNAGWAALRQSPGRRATSSRR